MPVTKRRYLALCLQQDADWLAACAANPTRYMRPIHVALVRIALRRKRGRD